jgi:UDP-N-acetylmuramate dehydrogenase
MKMMMTSATVDLLRERFGHALRRDVPLARYTSARVGGKADLLLSANSADELAAMSSTLWEMGTDFFLLGGGSNVLIGDAGVRGVTILNRAKEVSFDLEDERGVWAESGAAFSNLANRCARKGLSGLEWAATVPGTVGGAVYGNAGAFGGDMAGSLVSAEVLSPAGREAWGVAKLGYGYRTSSLKRHEVRAVVLSAEFNLHVSDPALTKGKIATYSERRKATQPPGASMGSMFKNPPGDYAGRLIEAAGLKGRRVGSAVVSTRHANFFTTDQHTRASDVRTLIETVQKTVQEKFGVLLELEIELVGEQFQ